MIGSNATPRRDPLPRDRVDMSDPSVRFCASRASQSTSSEGRHTLFRTHPARFERVTLAFRPLLLAQLAPGPLPVPGQSAKWTPKHPYLSWIDRSPPNLDPPQAPS